MYGEGIPSKMFPKSSTDQRSFYRVNVIDQRGTISFLAPPHGLKVLAAAITRGAQNGSELLAFSHAYDATWAAEIRMQVMRFDEHNVDHVADMFQDAIAQGDRPNHPAFRVMDQATRSRSLEPGKLGLVVFNLKERRIIQVQNNYADLQRKDRGRVRIGGEPSDQLFHYELPREWALVP